MNNLLAQASSFFIRCTGDKKYYESNESICTFQDFLDLLYRILHLSITVLAPLIVWGAWAIINTFFYIFNITLPCGAVWYSITPSCQ